MRAATAALRPNLSARLLGMLFACCAFLIAAPAAQADGELTRVHYPTQETTSFTVDFPSAWEMTPQGEGDSDYFELAGPNGIELSFRTVPGANLEAAIEAHVAYLKENFTDLNLGEATPAKIDGMEAIMLPATGTNEDGSVRDIGAGFFQISASEIGELWYNVEKTDGAGGAAAVAVLQSIKKGG